MKIRHLGTMTALLLLGLTALLAEAHTTATTVPKSGSVLDQSPPVIEINFKQPVRLTAVIVVEEGKPDRKLDFSPTESATAFKIRDPRLGAGHKTIKWKALSMDGHVVSGELVLNIRT